MVITERETETKQTPNYFSSRYYPEQTDEEESYSSYGNGYSSYQPQTYTQDDEEPAFSVESEYLSNDEQETNKSDYRVVTPRFVNVNRQEAVNAEQKTYLNARLSPRLKIAMTVVSLVFVLLFAFVIYNAIAIGNVNSQIASAQTQVRNEQRVINELEAEYNSLGSADTIRENVGSSFKVATSDDIVYQEAPIIDQPVEFNAPDNWFNQVCEFLSRLF